MSGIYKRPHSPYYWWTERYKGRKLYKSTKMTQKHLAQKVQRKWDLNLALGDVSFLRYSEFSTLKVKEYIRDYLQFIEERKSDNTSLITKGVLRKFSIYLESQNVVSLYDITVKLLDNYIDWLDCAPKTKKTIWE